MLKIDIFVCFVFNKTLVEKAKWELNKNSMCCFEQILETVPYKTATV